MSHEIVHGNSLEFTLYVMCVSTEWQSCALNPILVYNHQEELKQSSGLLIACWSPSPPAGPEADGRADRPSLPPPTPPQTPQLPPRPPSSLLSQYFTHFNKVHA
ncbi:unnamed protein product [Boreogadus saida]